MWIVFLGPPGAGKGTQAERVVGHLKIAHVSTGDMLRKARAEQTELGQHAESYLSAGQLVPDSLIMAMVAERLDEPDCRSGCLFDGFPRTLVQAEALDQLLAERSTPLDLVLDLYVDEQEVFHRLAARGRDDDKPQVIRERLNAYHEQTTPLTAYYERRGVLRRIAGDGTPDEVFLRIKSVLDESAGYHPGRRAR